MSMNPIDQPHFDRRLYRDPNPEVMSELRRLADTWRAGTRAVDEMRRSLDDQVVAAYDAGHSYAQMREQTGFGNGTLEMILAKAGRLRR
jgi:hypothetical protein